jgi:hypothetical protein
LAEVEEEDMVIIIVFTVTHPECLVAVVAVVALFIMVHIA